MFSVSSMYTYNWWPCYVIFVYHTQFDEDLKKIDKGVLKWMKLLILITNLLTIVIMFMKKVMCFWLVENECILMCSNTSANYK